MNRRTFLTGAALASVAAVAACAGKPITLDIVAEDAQTIAQGLQPVLAAARAVPGISKAALQKITDYLAALSSAAGQVITATANQKPSIVRQIVTTVQALAGAAGPLGLPAPIIGLIDAAVSLLPVLLAEAGISGAVSGLPAPKMSADEARVRLRAAALAGHV